MKKRMPWQIAIYCTIIMLYAVLIYVGYKHTTETSIKWWIVAIVAMICHLATTIKVVGERERATSVCLGKLLDALESGPHLTPWPMSIIRVSKNSIHIEFGTSSQGLGNTNQTSGTEPRMVLEGPVRINWGDVDSSNLTDDEKKPYIGDPHAVRMTTDPHIYVRIKVSNVREMIEELGVMDEAAKRIKDTCVTALQAIAGRTFVAKATREIDQISEELKKSVEDLVSDPQAVIRITAHGNPCGIDVEEVRLVVIGTAYAINTASVERASTIAKAKGEAAAVVEKAEAGRKSAIKIADGAAYATRVTADAEKHKLVEEGAGRASALEATAKAASTEEGQLIAKLDAFKEGMKHGKTVLLPNDSSFVTEAFKVVETLRSRKTGPTTPPPTGTP